MALLTGMNHQIEQLPNFAYPLPFFLIELIDKKNEVIKTAQLCPL